MSIADGAPYDSDEEQEGEEVFLDDDDFIQEIPIDDEDLPDRDDSDVEEEEEEEVDDSLFVFRNHTGDLSVMIKIGFFEAFLLIW